MKVNASPRPTTARAAMATGSDSVSARVSWPATIRVPPVTIIAFDPKRSSRTPAGICAAAYTVSWSTTNVDRIAGLAANRSAASSPATPNVVRSMTATV